jgi:hypothetical protein
MAAPCHNKFIPYSEGCSCNYSVAHNIAHLGTPKCNAALHSAHWPCSLAVHAGCNPSGADSEGGHHFHQVRAPHGARGWSSLSPRPCPRRRTPSRSAWRTRPRPGAAARRPAAPTTRWAWSRRRPWLGPGTLEAAAPTHPPAATTGTARRCPRARRPARGEDEQQADEEDEEDEVVENTTETEEKATKMENATGMEEN